MLLRCLKGRKKKNNVKSKTNKGRITMLSKFEVCNSKQSRFIKVREESGLLT